MNLYTEIIAVLAADAGVTSLVGGAATPRIWSFWPRSYDVPCVIVEIDGDEEQNDLSGQGGLNIGPVTITCRAATGAAAWSLWSAVRRVLAGYAGTFDAVLDGTADSDTPKAEGSTDHWYDRVMSFTVLRTEAA